MAYGFICTGCNQWHWSDESCPSVAPACSTQLPLTIEEQDDLFGQMDKWLADGGLRSKTCVTSEVENLYRMQATIRRQRNAISELLEVLREFVDTVNVVDPGVYRCSIDEAQAVIEKQSVG